MSTKYRYEFTPDAFKQNFRNLLEDLETLAASITSSLAQAVLLAGRAGGQQVAGGTAASEDLTLTSTANATKDRVYLGSAQASAFDELNNRLGIGTASPSMDITIEKTANSEVGLRVNNLSTGVSADARVTAAMGSNTVRIQQIAFSGTATTALSGITMAGWTTVSTINGSGLLVSTIPSSPIVFGTANTERMRILAGGTILTYQHVATSAIFSRSLSATLTNVTGLTFNVEAGRTYAFRAVLHYSADAVGGHKYAIGGTCTATSIRYQIDTIENATNAFIINSRQTALGGFASQAGATAGLTIIQGTIVVNAAGTLTVQFAQNAASGTSSIESGSSFHIFPV